MLLSNIQEANTVQDLLKIFDKYVVRTEFALGLQKLSQLASTENSDAVDIYAQSDDSLLTAIKFMAKYYPEDNEFTDKFSLSLVSRLRRINVHQVNFFFRN